MRWWRRRDAAPWHRPHRWPSDDSKEGEGRRGEEGRGGWGGEGGGRAIFGWPLSKAEGGEGRLFDEGQGGELTPLKRARGDGMDTGKVNSTHTIPPGPSSTAVPLTVPSSSHPPSRPIPAPYLPRPFLPPTHTSTAAPLMVLSSTHPPSRPIPASYLPRPFLPPHTPQQQRP